MDETGESGGTRERLLEAATRLFLGAPAGRAGLSLRAVTAAARANVAAVNYHFGSKEGLLRALASRLLEGVEAEQLQRLDQLLEGGEGSPTLEALLRAFGGPLFDLYDRHGNADWAPVFAAIRRASSQDAQHFGPASDGAVVPRYLAAMHGAAPWVPAAEFAWRFERARNLLLANQGRRLVSAYVGPAAEAASRDTERDWLVTFLASALSAPETPTHDQG